MLHIVGNVARVRSSYPNGHKYQFVGGGATHIALGAAGFGMRCAAVSVIGPDLVFALSALHERQVTIDTVRVIEGHSCTFELRYTEAADVDTVESDFGVSERLTAHALDVIVRGDAVLHICCRRPLDVSQLLPALRDRRFSVDFFMSSTGPNLLALGPLLHQSEAVFVNATEFVMLKSFVDVSHLRLVVVTDGPRNAVVMRAGTVVAEARPPLVEPLEFSGAGDTVTGVFLAAKASEWDDRDALRAAVEAASRSLTRVDLPIA